MHIILGVFGSVVTILILLNRLAEAGFDLGGLNPFLWHRRRKWIKQYQGDPLFKIHSPTDATAILMVAIVKADGDMTREDKSLLLGLFEEEFKLSKKGAAGLLISSVHLLGDGTQLRNNVKKFLIPSQKAFTALQALSAMALLNQVAAASGAIHPNAKELIGQVKGMLEPDRARQPTW
jgi:uncharacterized tellurite resistance protein B-like protein